MKKRKSIGISNGWQKRYAHAASSCRNHEAKMDCTEYADASFHSETKHRKTEGSPINREELDFFKSHFSEGLTSKNRRYTEQRHMERVRTIEEMYCTPKTAPEEVSFQVKPHGQESLDTSVVEQIIKKQLQWEHEQFPQIHYFFDALQEDELDEGAFRVRRVWIAHDKAGNEIVSERKALREMGIERPEASQKEGRFNNAKMTYTTMCRKHLNQLCATYKVDITIESKGKKRHKKSLQAIDSSATKAEIDAIKQEIKVLKKKLNDVKAEIKRERQRIKESQNQQ